MLVVEDLTYAPVVSRECRRDESACTSGLCVGLGVLVLIAGLEQERPVLVLRVSSPT
jgi:hypothetical protein